MRRAALRRHAFAIISLAWRVFLEYVTADSVGCQIIVCFCASLDGNGYNAENNQTTHNIESNIKRQKIAVVTNGRALRVRQ